MVGDDGFVCCESTIISDLTCERDYTTLDALVYERENSNKESETRMRHEKNQISRAVTYATGVVLSLTDRSCVIRARRDVTISVTLPGTARGSIQNETKDIETINVEGKKIEMRAVVSCLSKWNSR